LHRLLDRALLCGASILGPELAIAILTEISYTYNCRRRSEKRNWNAKVTPVIPIEGLASLRQYENTGVNPLTASHLKVQDEPVELDGFGQQVKMAIMMQKMLTQHKQQNTFCQLQMQHVFDVDVAKPVLSMQLNCMEFWKI